MTKAVALLSGGLDSTLAVKVMIEQGIDVYALNFVSAFCTCTSGGKRESSEGGRGARGGCTSEARRVAEEFGIPIKVMAKGADYIEVVRSPKYGYGKAMNPCMDCRLYIFKKAREYMEEIGASFIITGEVLGQRPMSQRRDCFGVLEKESGLEGLILKPLSAKHLEPTIPEKTGLVDRDKLLGIVGRSRKPQIELAGELDIRNYPCPAGGCLLTDRIFAKKVRDLLDHKKDITPTDLLVLKTGRHFRFAGVKVVVGRVEAENAKLKKLVQPGDTLVEPEGFPGPTVLVAGAMENGLHGFVGRVVLRYAPKAGGSGRLKATRNNVETRFEAGEKTDDKANEETVEEFQIC